HQLAQKLISTTWPLRSARLTGAPIAAGSWKAAAGDPAVTLASVRECAAEIASTASRADSLKLRVVMTASVRCERAPAAPSPLEEYGRTDRRLKIVLQLVHADVVGLEYQVLD